MSATLIAPRGTSLTTLLAIQTTLLAIVLTACAAEPRRSYSDGVFVSTGDPQMRIAIEPRFEYLGEETFLLGTTHEAQRHHWVTTQDGRVTALIVFQFERILDGVEGKYEFNVPPPKFLSGSNYRFAAEPVRLGGHDWVHNTWAFDTKASAREQPGRESDRTLRLLAANGYEIDAGLVMARYVRAVGEEQRKEIILFYMEPLRAHGHTIEQFPDGGPRSSAFERLSDDLAARAGRAFRVL